MDASNREFNSVALLPFLGTGTPGKSGSGSGDLDSDLRILGLRERICIMEKTAHCSHFPSKQAVYLDP